MKKRGLPDELQFLANRKATQKPFTDSMEGKTCVLTGGTSGVGLEAARSLASHGARLLLVARNPDKAAAVVREITSSFAVTAEAVIADFADLDQVRRAAAEILERCPRIDVLINCAGMHSTKRTLTPEGFETVFCVNHLASFLLTCLLLERLKTSAPARIIQVNSEGHRFGGLNPDDLSWVKRHYTGLKGYGASKTAQLLTVWDLSDRLRGSGVTINAMHPGDVRTNIGQNNGWLYRFFKKQITDRMLMDASISGPAIGYLASSPELAAVSGRFFHLTNEEKPAAHALDRAMGRRIWDLSLQMTGLLYWQ